MSTRRQFFELIRRTPEDDTPRLVYADWLDEQGDPRGEFIRVQCELAKLTYKEPSRQRVLKEREMALLKAHRREWSRSLRKFHVRSAVFCRGFFETAVLMPRTDAGGAAEQFLIDWNDLVDWEPGLAQVSLHLIRDWNQIKLLDYAPPLKSLHVNYQGLTHREISQIVRWPVVENLSELDLSHNNLQSRLECIARAPGLDRLKVLNLSYNQIGNRGARALASSSHLQQVNQLKLHGNPIGKYCKELLREAFGARLLV